MYVIKQQPEDFQVKELSNIKTKQEGEYTYFILIKKNYTTIDALQKISNILRIPLKNLGFAGTKDKRAITEQTCSAKNVSKGQLEKIKIKDIELKFLGKADKPISLGDHLGNYFKITVSNITKLPEIKTKFINFFGEQRFSTNNATIGKLIVQKKFKEACNYLIENKIVQNYLQTNSTDYVGAIKKIPIKIIKFYVHSYQSDLWNKMAQQNNTEQTLPIIGFATQQTKEIMKILNQEEITTRDFINKQIPQISSEGDQRETLSQAKKLVINKLEEDELNKGMKKITIEFELNKGSYATEFIKQSFLE